MPSGTMFMSLAEQELPGTLDLQGGPTVKQSDTSVPVLRRNGSAPVLTFDREAILGIIEHTKQAIDRSPTYGQEEPVPPGAWLVGDQGVYIMSNGRNEKGQHGWRAHPTAYANECHPRNCPHWYEVKQRTWGGNDGTVFLEAELLQELCNESLATIGVAFNGDDIEFIPDPA